MFEIKRDIIENLKKINKEIDLSKNNIFVEDNIHLLNELVNNKIKVDLIYIDPPYNTKKNIFKYKDNRKTEEWVSFIYERVLLSKEILEEHGVILISIDDNHYPYIKLIMDNVFGIKNFVCNFIWKKSHTVKNDKNGISTQQEYVLCFAKDKRKTFLNRENVGLEYINKAYRYNDERGRFRVVPLHKEKNKNRYDIVSPSGIIWNKGWNYNKDGFEKLLKDDLIYWGKDGDRCPSKKVYLKDVMNKSFGSILPTTVGYTGDGKSDLKNLGFDGNTFLYAKPVNLIKHFINIFTKKDSIVLDFFAGSGTTGEAVIEKNIEDDGSRTFILATNNEEMIATTITIPRILNVYKKHSLDKENLIIYNEDNFQ